MSLETSRRDFLESTWKLTSLGGAGLLTAAGSFGPSGLIRSSAAQDRSSGATGEIRPQRYYRPADGTLGDPIPFFWKGHYHIFHVGGGEWQHLVSEDLLRWRELPTAIPRGGPGEPDSSQCASGSIIQRQGTFHIFYLGRSEKDGRRIGTVCHATSRDLVHWEKDPANPLLRPDYENYAGVTKDPFVFWNARDQRYWMLIADRLRHAPTNRKGVLALATSPDLQRWQRRQEPFWAPDSSTGEFEVPDLFEWNRRFYLTYTTYMERTGTHYRVADQASGPWLAPAVDSFDDHLYYAGKTMSDGKRRLAFAFVRGAGAGPGVPPADRKQALIIREVLQKPDGSLAFKCPQELLDCCGPELPLKFASPSGHWSQQDRRAHARRLDGLAYAVTEPVAPDGLLELVLTLKPNTRSAGIFFRTTGDLERGYMLRLEPSRGRIVFERWPKSWPWKQEFWRNIGAARGTHPFMVQRTVLPEQFSWERPMTVQLFLQGTIAEVFVNQELALVARIYEHRDGCLALFVEHGEADFEGMTFRPLP
jgi:beta-fructofuranosidase